VAPNGKRTYRVWFRNGSAVIVSAVGPHHARQEAQKAAEISNMGIRVAYKKARADGQDDRALELAKEWADWTVTTKAELF
jgi:hypothetical protein